MTQALPSCRTSVSADTCQRSGHDWYPQGHRMAAHSHECTIQLQELGVNVCGEAAFFVSQLIRLQYAQHYVRHRKRPNTA
ncbi:methylenetetrahydrofolate dehydrogenase-like protein [Leishmania tarentolae]|uniref:Methylenetetrahydrofolate dehydrogenase-like protein n=1 Tax=Leishmania tarentolae TaxID=5689 RepID=A0A640KHG9_LEITA|nr:methylenetetrahydrofolate dehydrogenase-like protein [Leishmania tarentolae]